jgi:uncharacterized membrane protein
MLSSHLRVGLPSGLLLSGLPTKILYAPLTSPMRATCPAHLILLALITLTILGEEYKPCSSSLCGFLQPPVTSSLIGPNILLSTLFSNTLNLCSSLNVRDQVSHPYKTTGKIIILLILNYGEVVKIDNLQQCVTHQIIELIYRRHKWSKTSFSFLIRFEDWHV